VIFILNILPIPVNTGFALGVKHRAKRKATMNRDMQDKQDRSKAFKTRTFLRF
jgi:hypothetical protein